MSAPNAASIKETGISSIKFVPSRSNMSCADTRIMTIKSPAGPPFIPGPPFPFYRRRVPSTTVAGMRIFTDCELPGTFPAVTDVSSPVIASSKVNLS